MKSYQWAVRGGFVGLFCVFFATTPAHAGKFPEVQWYCTHPDCETAAHHHFVCSGQVQVSGHEVQIYNERSLRCDTACAAAHPESPELCKVTSAECPSDSDSASAPGAVLQSGAVSQ